MGYFLVLGQSNDWLFADVSESPHGYGIQNPSEADIRRVIEAIARNEQDLAILYDEADPDTYIQTASGGRGGFLLEYQEKSIEAHYTATTPNITADQVIGAFLATMRGDAAWKTQFAWRKLK